MRIYTIILTAFAALAVTACSTTQTVNQTTNQTQTEANRANQTNQAVVETKPTAAALSPKETLMALDEASRKRDVAAVKSYLSQGTLDLFNKEAEKQKKPLDEILRDEILNEENLQDEEAPDLRNEKIEGDKATVEVKNTLTGEYDPFPLVKENGVWKVALDVYAKELEKKMLEEMNKSPQNSAEKPKANKP